MVEAQPGRRAAAGVHRRPAARAARRRAPRRPSTRPASTATPCGGSTTPACRTRRWPAPGAPSAPAPSPRPPGCVAGPGPPQPGLPRPARRRGRGRSPRRARTASRGPGRSSGPWSSGHAQLDDLVGLLDQQRGVIVAGAGAGDAGAVHGLAARAGWPVLADPPSGCRRAPADDGGGVRRPPPPRALRGRPHADGRAPAGRPPASKVLAQWLAASGARQVQVDPSGRWIDPEHTAAVTVTADPTALCRALSARLTGGDGDAVGRAVDVGRGQRPGRHRPDAGRPRRADRARRGP